jgi:hypothetical protein
MFGPTNVEALLLGRQLDDPKLYQAFKEVNDKLERLLTIFDISEENTIGLGFSPHPNAILDLKSIVANDPRRKMGLGLPTLTLSDKLNIPGPQTGLLLYDSTGNCISYFNGTAWVNFSGSLTSAGTVGSAGVAETPLFEIPLHANFLGRDGQSLDFTYIGTTAANGNNKRIRIYLGSTLINDTGVVVWNNLPTICIGTVLRLAYNSQIAQSLFNNSPNDIQTRVTPTEDLTTALTLKVTGTGTVNNDIVGNLLRVDPK